MTPLTPNELQDEMERARVKFERWRNLRRRAAWDLSRSQEDFDATEQQIDSRDRAQDMNQV